MKRSGTSHHHLIQRIPADVLAKARGSTLAVPVGEGTVAVTISAKAKDVRVSLRTRDPAEAKVRQAAATAYLGTVWEAFRQGPRRLTHKETVALAGEAYNLEQVRWRTAAKAREARCMVPDEFAQVA